MQTKTYRKTATVEAVQLTENSYDEILAWVEGSLELASGDGVVIPTLEGDHVAGFGDWIAKGVEGEFWPIKGSVFGASYVEVGNDEA